MQEIPVALNRFQDWLISEETVQKVKHQSILFDVQRWELILKENALFSQVFQHLVLDNPEQEISRIKLVEYAHQAYQTKLVESRQLFLLATLIWGNGNQPRGNNVQNLLAIPHLHSTLSKSMDYLEKNLLDLAFSEFNSESSRIKYFSTSFFTKILYFAGLALNLVPLPLILDGKVAKNWHYLTKTPLDLYSASATDYLGYINKVNQWAKYLNCRADTIEYWLFISPPEFLER